MVNFILRRFYHNRDNYDNKGREEEPLQEHLICKEYRICSTTEKKMSGDFWEERKLLRPIQTYKVQRRVNLLLRLNHEIYTGVQTGLSKKC